MSLSIQFSLLALGIILVVSIYLAALGKKAWQSKKKKNRQPRSEHAEPALGRKVSESEPALDMVNDRAFEQESKGGKRKFLYTEQEDGLADRENTSGTGRNGEGDPQDSSLSGLSEPDDASTMTNVDMESDSLSPASSHTTGAMEEPGETTEHPEPNTRLQPAPGFERLSQIDYYVKLSGGKDVSRDSVLAVYREAAAGISKAHSLHGLRLPDKVWVDVENQSEETRFADLVITIQLADCDGPLVREDLVRFSNMVSKLSESTGRGFSFMTPMECAEQQAAIIDRLRQQFDSIFVLNVRPLEDETFDGAEVERFATHIGLTPTSDTRGFFTRFKLVEKQKVRLYSIANMSDSGQFDFATVRGTWLNGVTFFTHPAVNRMPGAVFSEMVDAAKVFASRVKGEMIAPGYEELSNESILTIRRSIEEVAKEMESYGIVPGSPEAIRLFDPQL